jgi:hypothetical protein
MSLATSDPASVEKANNIAHIAAQTAEKLGFDPKLITVSDESKTFELNGKTMYYAGAAILPRPAMVGKLDVLSIQQVERDGALSTRILPQDSTEVGPVVLYSSHIGSDPKEVAGITAHEIEHQKFQAFINDYRAERARMEKDPAYLATFPKWSEDGKTMISRGTNDFMRPDGLLRDPHADRYPTYQSYTQAMMPSISDFAKTDGVTGYSRDWWNAWENRTANTEQAMHETLAEIANLKRIYEFTNAENKEAHEKNVAYIREHGGQWTPEQEAEWKAYNNRNNLPIRIIHLMRKPTKDGAAMFLTTKRGLDPNWNRLYKAVDANWKRRNKTK